MISFYFKRARPIMCLLPFDRNDVALAKARLRTDDDRKLRMKSKAAGFRRIDTQLVHMPAMISARF